jgi:hypothetical protein
MELLQWQDFVIAKTLIEEGGFSVESLDISDLEDGMDSLLKLIDFAEYGVIIVPIDSLASEFFTLIRMLLETHGHLKFVGVSPIIHDGFWDRALDRGLSGMIASCQLPNDIAEIVKDCFAESTEESR